MSRKPSFANLRDRVIPNQDPGFESDSGTTSGQATSFMPALHDTRSAIAGNGPSASRQGRKQIAGFFSPDMSLAMHVLARRQGRSLQSLMAEAFNDVLRKHGESPIGD